jgi:class 3 adenylate cyclase/pimeloyl-ACP methyl ester carboxylesterase
VNEAETKFAKLGEDRIAYQVLGSGPTDLLYMPASGHVIDVIWEYPPLAETLRKLASFSRLITFDRRGTGASDAAPMTELASWERWAEDARAVLDAVGSERASILAGADGGPTAILFAATHPERTSALVLLNTTARFLKDDDYPWGLTEAELGPAEAFLEENWGTEAMGNFANRDLPAGGDHARWWAKSSRLCWTPRAAAQYFRWVQRTDVRQVLSSIRAPTLVLHRKEAEFITLDQGRYLADHIPGARFVPLDGTNMNLYFGETKDVLDHIEDFVKRFAGSVDSDRALAAVLFTDIVGSTQRAALLGDSQWRNVLDSHDVVARTLVDQHRGHLVKLTGDGVLARFDGPGRAIRCAFALRDALEPLGIEIRAGLHTGEVELRGADIGGIAVHIAERVHTFAQPGEVLVSETVPRLVTGSGIEFVDRGEHELKGVPGTWRLFSVAG